MNSLRLLAIILICPLLTSCGGDGLARTAVSGTVTLDGKTIDNGYITFSPKPGTQCPSIAGQIKNGTFNIPKKDGPVVGSYSVTIAASAPTGKKIKVPMSNKESDEMVSIIPAQYAGFMGKSSLTATIEKGKNELKFDLVSDTK